MMEKIFYSYFSHRFDVNKMLITPASRVTEKSSKKAIGMCFQHPADIQKSPRNPFVRPPLFTGTTPKLG